MSDLVREAETSGTRGEEQSIVLVGVARVEYPHDWSTKGGATRAPHLSTIDAIRIADECAARLPGQVPAVASTSIQRSLSVRAGARPWEDLGRVPIRSTLTWVPGQPTVRLQHAIGSLRVDSEWDNSAGPLAVNEHWSAGEATEIALGPESTVHCHYERAGTGAALISFSEVLMVTAQMSQVALYDGHADRRDRSGNMWMRRATFVRRAQTVQNSGAVDLALSNRRVLQVNGRTVETADVHAVDVFGVYVTASLAIGA